MLDAISTTHPSVDASLVRLQGVLAENDIGGEVVFTTRIAINGAMPVILFSAQQGSKEDSRCASSGVGIVRGKDLEWVHRVRNARDGEMPCWKIGGVADANGDGELELSLFHGGEYGWVEALYSPSGTLLGQVECSG